MLNLFHPVQKFFYHSASAGHTSLTNSLKKYFFQGFEWDGIVKIKKVQDINDVCYDEDVFSNIEKALSYEPISCRARLKNKAKSVLRFLNPFLIRNKIKEKRFSSAHKKWVARKGDNTHRLNYDLDCDSVVFDLGGYEGDFTDAIFRRYGCNIYVFEPVISFYNKIDRRFAGNEKIKVFNFGLSDSDKLLEINLDADGSSIFKVGNNKEVINLKDICSFIRSENLNKVDLMKINIEGGEFEVLPALITSNAIEIFKNIQVQFHDFIEGAENKRKKIRKGLEKTHYVTFNYWFVWEGWRRKSK
jgi:FkbM family methyltransferase